MKDVPALSCELDDISRELVLKPGSEFVLKFQSFRFGGWTLVLAAVPVR